MFCRVIGGKSLVNSDCCFVVGVDVTGVVEYERLEGGAGVRWEVRCMGLSFYLLGFGEENFFCERGYFCLGRGSFLRFWIGCIVSFYVY